MRKNKLSIFVDESGNFGFNSDGASRFYIVSFVFHNQKDDIKKQLDRIKNEPVFHINPLISGKNEFSNFDLKERQKLLNKILIFTSIVPIKQKTFIYDKKDFEDNKDKLINKISMDLLSFLLSFQSYFLSFKEIVIYYDGGQQILNSALKQSFEQVGFNVSYKENVKAKNYRLFQVADFITTIVLIYTKLINYKRLSKKESAFVNERHLKNLFYRTIKKKELK